MKNNLKGRPSLQTIVEKMPGHVWWKNSQLHYLGCNDRVLKILGLSREQFIGKTDHELWRQDIADNLLNGDLQVLKTGEPINLEEIIVEKDGTELVMLTNKSPYFDRQHNIIGIIGTSTDITSRKQADQELKVAKEAAEAANKAKTEFLENMRHDIRTPLVGITGCANAVKEIIDDPQKIDEAKEYIDNLIISCQALFNLLNEILEITKISSYETPLLKKKFDLKEKLLNIIRLNQSKASQKHLELILDYDDNIPHYVIGDPMRTQRVILELMTNALNFTKEGFVKITTQLAKRNDKNLIIKIRIEDTGIGIAEDKQQEVFMPFKRLTPSCEENYRGAGLGLALVKQLIEDLEGEIYLESELQKGAAFTCVISLKEALLDEQFGADNAYLTPKTELPQSKNYKVPTTQEKATIKSPSVLLVEDNAIAAKLTESLLLGLGCKVDVARDGMSALKLAKNYNYDLILMDIGLPDVSGNEVTKEIREWEISQHKHTPIIALTAHVDAENKEQCLQAGMETVLSKPLAKETALTILNAFMFGHLKRQKSRKM